MPHESTESRRLALRINLTQHGDVLELEQVGSRSLGRLAVQLSPDPEHVVGVGAAEVALEWSLDGHTWFAIKSGETDVVLDAADPAVLGLDVTGHVRLRVEIADGFADAACAVVFNFVQGGV